MSATRGSRAFSNVQLESLRYQRSAIPAAGGVMSVDGDGGIGVTTNLSMGTISVTGHAALNTINASSAVANSLRVLGGATIATLDTNNVIIRNGLTVTTLGVSGSASVGGILGVGGTLTAPTIIVTDIAVTNLILPTTIAQPIGTTLICAPQILAGTTYNVPFLSHYALDVSGSAQISAGLTVSVLNVIDQINLPTDVVIDELRSADIYGLHILAGSEVIRNNPYALWVVDQAVFEEGVTVYGPMALADTITGTVAQMNSIVVGGTVQTQGIGVSGQANVGSLNVTTGITAAQVYAPGATFGVLQILNGTVLSGGLTVDTLSVTGSGSIRTLTVGETAQVQSLGVTGLGSLGSLVVGESAQVKSLGVTGLGSLGSLVVGSTAQVLSLGVTNGATIGSLSVTTGLTTQGLSAQNLYAANGTIGVFNSPNATVDAIQIVDQMTFDPAAVIVFPTSYHTAVLANQMVAGTTNLSELSLLYAMDVSGAMLVKGGATVQGPLVGSSANFSGALSAASGSFSGSVASAGISGTTANFSGNATIGGGLTVSGLLVGSSGLNTTSGSFSGSVASVGLAGTTANFSGNATIGGGLTVAGLLVGSSGLNTTSGSFSGNVSSVGLAGTTANFSNDVTVGGGITATGNIRGNTVKSTTSMSAQGMNICTVINSGVPTSGLFIGQGSGTIPYDLPDAGGAVLTWNTVKSLNTGGQENGNFEMVIGSGTQPTGNLRIYNTIGANGTTANQNTLTLSRTGNLSLLGSVASAGISGTTANFSGNATIGGGLTVTGPFVASGGITTNGIFASSSISSNTIKPYSGTAISILPNSGTDITLNVGDNAGTSGGQVYFWPVVSMNRGAYVAGQYGLQIGKFSGISTPNSGSGSVLGWNTTGAGNLEMVMGAGSIAGGGGFDIYNTTTISSGERGSRIFALDRLGNLNIAGSLASAGISGTTASFNSNVTIGGGLTVTGAIATTTINATGVNNELYVTKGTQSMVLAPNNLGATNFNVNTQPGDAVLSYTGATLTIGSNNNASRAGAIRLLQNGNIQGWAIANNNSSSLVDNPSSYNALQINMTGMTFAGSTTYTSNRFVELVSGTSITNSGGGYYVAAPGFRIKGADQNVGALSYGAYIEIDGGRVAAGPQQKNGQIRFYTGAQANNMTLDENGNLNVTGTITSAGGNAVPVGTIMMYASSSMPAGGWLVCNGGPVSKTTYAALYALLLDTYGTATATDFYLPDLRSRVPVGAGTGPGMSDTYNIGNMGGAEGVTLNFTQIPAHTHGVNLTTDPNGAHTHQLDTAAALDQYRNGVAGVNRLAENIYANINTNSAGNHSHTVTGNTDNGTGGGQSHENRQPYLVINYIIKF
jgi:microcystin-dependent protein